MSQPAPSSWVCKARDRNNRPCSEELGIVQSGRLLVRVGLVVEADKSGAVTITCPVDYRHRRTWVPDAIKVA